MAHADSYLWAILLNRTLVYFSAYEKQAVNARDWIGKSQNVYLLLVEAGCDIIEGPALNLQDAILQNYSFIAPGLIPTQRVTRNAAAAMQYIPDKINSVSPAALERFANLTSIKHSSYQPLSSYKSPEQYRHSTLYALLFVQSLKFSAHVEQSCYQNLKSTYELPENLRRIGFQEDDYDMSSYMALSLYLPKDQRSAGIHVRHQKSDSVEAERSSVDDVYVRLLTDKSKPFGNATSWYLAADRIHTMS